VPFVIFSWQAIPSIMSSPSAECAVAQDFRYVVDDGGHGPERTRLDCNASAYVAGYVDYWMDEVAAAVECECGNDTFAFPLHIRCTLATTMYERWELARVA
jgi:hypothetical protein